MSKITVILALILGAALALFVVENQELVALHFFWITARALPVSLALLTAAVFGLLVGLLLALPGRITSGRREGRLRRNVGRLEARETTPSASFGSTPTASIDAPNHPRARPRE